MSIGLAIGAGIGQAAAGTAGNIISGEYQKALQKDAQNFTREQSQNQIKYNIQQMKDLGYSPSMLFNGNTPSGGGAGGGNMGKAPDFAQPILQAINTVGNLWMKDKELDNKTKSLDLQERNIDNNIKNLDIKERYLDNNSKKLDLNKKYLDLQEERIVNENSASIAKLLNQQAQERYWEQRYYNLDPRHPLNSFRNK